jgi:hypothetical protein
LEKSQLQKKGKIATINCTHGVIYDWDLYLSHTHTHIEHNM